MRVINIPTKEHNFYRTYLEFLNPILGLTDKERMVLAELLYWNNQYKGLEESIRNKLVFDYDTKMKIVDKLAITHQILLNNITALRKKGWVEGNKLSTKLLSIVDDENRLLSIKFTVI